MQKPLLPSSSREIDKHLLIPEDERCQHEPGKVGYRFSSAVDVSLKILDRVFLLYKLVIKCTSSITPSIQDRLDVTGEAEIVLTYGQFAGQGEAEDERGGLQNAGRVASPQTGVPAFLFSSRQEPDDDRLSQALETQWGDAPLQ